MTNWIVMLRAVNVSGTSIVKMEALRAMCEGMGLQKVRTYIQSGNIVFRTKQTKIAKKLEKELHKTFGLQTKVIARTAAEMRNVVERNPFPGQEGSKLLVFFLEREARSEAEAEVAALQITPEEIRIDGREVFFYFPDGQGKSKIPMARITKALGCAGTGRNWNSVVKLLAMGEEA